MKSPCLTGRQLDGAVLQALTGYPLSESGETYYRVPDAEYSYFDGEYPVPHYSESLDSAFDALMELLDRTDEFGIKLYHVDIEWWGNSDRWYVAIERKPSNIHSMPPIWFRWVQESLITAILNAVVEALKS